MTVHPLPSRRRRLVTRALARSVMAALLAVIGLAAFVVVALIALGFRDDLEVLHQIIGRIKPYLAGLHLLAIGALWLPGLAVILALLILAVLRRLERPEVTVARPD